MATTSSAAAAPAVQAPGTLALLSALIAIAVFGWALLAIRRMLADVKLARLRLAEAEAELNEAQALITAEPGILFIWRGQQDEPNRIAGDMRGLVAAPTEREELADFFSWIEAESASTLSERLAQLREAGLPFNIGLKTAEGELVEADGRAAGGLATLRLRPITGERRDLTELTYDTRRLAKQVERLSAILDLAPFPIAMRGGDGKLAWVNQSYMKAVECTDYDEVIRRNLELVDTAKAPAGTEAEAGGPIKAHAVIGGQKRELEIHSVPFGDGTASYAIDMTALAQARQELKRHIRAHASTLDKIATAIAIFGQDQRLSFYNSAYADLWGLDPGWLDLRPRDGEILDRLREERRLPEQANYRDWRAKQLASYTNLEARENWWHLPDGRTLRVISEQHPFGGVTTLYEDVTEKILLESRYNELIDVQRETLDNLHEGLALFGTDGRLKLYNPPFGRFWQLPDDFLSGQPHVDEVVARCQRLFDADEVWHDMKLAVTSLSEGRRTLHDRLARDDGMVLDYATVPLPDGNTLVTYVDVTASAGIERALRERNDALEAADRLKTNFLSNVSYELRTPLTNIAGFGEALDLGIAGPLNQKQTEYVRDIRASSNDLMAIIDAILDLTTIDAGAMELSLAEVDVAELLTEVAQDFADRIGPRDIVLSVEIAEDAGLIVGDGRRIRQVVANLLSNAIGFSPPGSTVRMGGRADGTDMLIWVADTGRGMDEDFQKKAFDRFNSRPVAGGHRGPGLGLAIVKSFVDLHGGQVSLISKIGRGTTVICRFPVAGPGAAARAGRKAGRV